MAARVIERGPTAETVSQNLGALMKQRGITTDELSQRLTAIGRPILATGITKIVGGSRRVDVDDLMTLAIALDVSPLTLLLPREDLGTTHDVTGGMALGGRLWEWARGDVPLTTIDFDDVAAYRMRALPDGFRSLRALARDIEESWTVRIDSVEKEA